MGSYLSDPAQAAFRLLAERDRAVGEVWHMELSHFDGKGLPGYFHLGKAAPYYDRATGRRLFGEGRERD